MSIKQVNIYKNLGQWCYAVFNNDGFDSSDTIGCDDDASDEQAEAAVIGTFGQVKVSRVDDTNIA